MIRIGNHLTPYLLLVCISLASVLFMQTRDGGETVNDATPRTSQQAPAQDTSPVGKDFSAPPLGSFQEISRRPLFLSERKPPPPPPVNLAPRQAAPVRPLGLVLEGIIVTSTEKTAMVVNISNSEVLHLGIGMQHQGWELVSMTPLTATFQQGEQSQELTLEE